MEKRSNQIITVEATVNATINETKIVESFESESTHSLEQQQSAWQAILDNFKKYTEQTIL